MPEEKIYRIEDDKILGGVCAGIAEQYETDVNIVRVLTLLVVLLTFPIGLLAYLAAWYLIPKKPEQTEDN